MDKRRQDLNFCWEQILALDPWFKLNFLFAPGELKDRLLALHALYASIDHALRIGEENLSRVRLAWLARELELAGRSEFPIVRLLHVSGALERIPQRLLAAMMEEAHLRIDAGRPGRLSDLKASCNQTGWTRMAMELSLNDRQQLAHEDIEQRCAGSGAHYLMRVSDRPSAETLGFIPLELLARHQVSTGQLSGSSGSVLACRVDFVESIRDWTIEQIESLYKLARNPACEGMALQHPAAFTVVCAQRARKLEILNGGVSVPRWGAGDVLRVWSGCRRLKVKP